MSTGSLGLVGYCTNLRDAQCPAGDERGRLTSILPTLWPWEDLSGGNGGVAVGEVDGGQMAPVLEPSAVDSSKNPYSTSTSSSDSPSSTSAKLLHCSGGVCEGGDGGAPVGVGDNCVAVGEVEGGHRLADEGLNKQHCKHSIWPCTLNDK
eukprot:SM000051S17557  [mRNA]  locus=s51:316903:327632:+ [translate_table: standard]